MRYFSLSGGLGLTATGLANGAETLIAPFVEIVRSDSRGLSKSVCKIVTCGFTFFSSLISSPEVVTEQSAQV